MKTIRELKSKLAKIKAKVRELKRNEKVVASVQRRREIATRLRDGDSIAAKIMLAKRAGRRSAELQRELGWPNLQRAWKARRKH